MSDKHGMSIHASRNRRTPFIDYSRAIANVRKELQEEIDALDNRIVFNNTGVATISYSDPSSFVTATTQTLSGTTAGAANIFKNIISVGKPMTFSTTDSVGWLSNTTQPTNSLFGVLSYIGTVPIRANVSMKYTVQSPDKGASLGWELTFRTYVNDEIIYQENNGVEARDPSAIPTLLSTTPLTSVFTANSQNTFQINPQDKISVKVVVNNAGDIPSFKVLDAVLSITYNSNQYTNPLV